MIRMEENHAWRAIGLTFNERTLSAYEQTRELAHDLDFVKNRCAVIQSVIDHVGSSSVSVESEDDLVICVTATGMFIFSCSDLDNLIFIPDILENSRASSLTSIRPIHPNDPMDRITMIEWLPEWSILILGSPVGGIVIGKVMINADNKIMWLPTSFFFAQFGDIKNLRLSRNKKVYALDLF